MLDNYMKLPVMCGDNYSQRIRLLTCLFLVVADCNLVPAKVYVRVVLINSILYAASKIQFDICSTSQCSTSFHGYSVQQISN